MLTSLKNFKEKTECPEVIRHLKRFHGAAEFGEVFEEGEDVLKKMEEIFDEVSSLVATRLGEKVSDLFKYQSKIEDNF